MAVHRTYPKKPGFRLGIYVCKDAEIVDFAAPHGVFSVTHRFDPELDAFLIAEALLCHLTRLVYNLDVVAIWVEHPGCEIVGVILKLWPFPASTPNRIFGTHS